MHTKIEGFLFGHYDSRGGATFIKSESKEKAYEIYGASFFLENEIEAHKEQAKEICDDDFLGTATLETNEEVANGMDLEYGEEGDRPVPLWVQDFTEGEGGEGRFHLQYGGECPPNHKESELGEDAFGVILVLEQIP